MTLLEEFATLLAQRGHGTYEDDDGTIFLAALPSKPDACMAVARYPGGESDSKLPYDEVHLQIRCRGGADPRTAEGAAQAVYDELHGLGTLTLPGGTWLQLAVGNQGGPIYIGRDQNGRHEFTVNVRAEVRRPTPHRV